MMFRFIPFVMMISCCLIIAFRAYQFGCFRKHTFLDAVSYFCSGISFVWIFMVFDVTSFFSFIGIIVSFLALFSLVAVIPSLKNIFSLLTFSIFRRFFLVLFRFSMFLARLPLCLFNFFGLAIYLVIFRSAGFAFRSKTIFPGTRFMELGNGFFNLAV